MLHFTLIARQTDALALSADTETSGGSDLERNKVTAKNILRKLALDASRAASGAAAAAIPPLLSVESQSFAYHVLSEGGVLFLTMCDTSAPASLAFAYLEDVAREFLQQYGGQIAGATRPYSFIKFDLYLQKTKKVFSNSARGTASMQRAGRPTPVKKSFREIMGQGEGPTTGNGSAGAGTSSGVSIKDNGIMMAAVGGAVLLLVVILLYIALA